MPLLETEQGPILTTESGIPLGVDVITNNNEIQVFDFSVDLLQALLWQYNNAANLQSIIASKQAWYNDNQQAFWDAWITNVFNLHTANEFGLAIWSIILGLPLFINNPAPVDEPLFGFGSANGAVNFGNGILGNSDGAVYNLPLETKRIALKLRYFQLTSSGTVPETNRMLAYVFASYGKAYLLDYGTMSQAYIFLFQVPWDLAYIFNNLDILPRPAGVGSQWIDGTQEFFGFGPVNPGFNQAILGG